MTLTSKADIEIFCFDCKARRLGDPQTGRCRTCGKVQMASSGIAEEFGHPILERNAGVSRKSPSAAYRSNGSNGSNGSAAAAASTPAAAPEPASEPPSLVAVATPEPIGAVVDEQHEDEDVVEAWLERTRALRDVYLADAEAAAQLAKDTATRAKRLREIADQMAYVIELVGDARSSKSAS